MNIKSIPVFVGTTAAMLGTMAILWTGCSKEQVSMTTPSATDALERGPGDPPPVITGMLSGNSAGYTAMGGSGVALSTCTSGVVCYTNPPMNPEYAVVEAGGRGFIKGQHAGEFGPWYYVKPNNQPLAAKWLKVRFRGSFPTSGQPAVASYSPAAQTWSVNVSSDWEASAVSPVAGLSPRHWCPPTCLLYLD